ncbi:tripartite motif-containing protein 29-like [Mercenaria mercenaria]|uniref:tripartite motif-containing protein 29-like n=1 Tax=Mercenaria mercenaria TaxID=6596 RepID=UPI00234F03B8|nr:tripartite motif-containing protein 29-like [Mercenaria mercenaria]
MPKRKVSVTLSENCVNHQGETLNYYCETHDIVACTLCIFQEHRNCTDICTVVKKADKIKDSASYKELCMKLTEAGERIGKQIKEAKLKMKISENSTEEAVSSIDKFQKELNEKIDSLRNQMVKESEDLQNGVRLKMNEVEEKAKRAKGELEDLQNDIQFLEEANLHSQLFIAANKASKQHKGLEDALRQMEIEKEIKKYRFIPNQILINLMQNVDSLGELFVQDIDNPSEPPQSFYENYLEYGFRKWLPLSEASIMVLDHVQNCIYLVEKK